MDQFIDCLTQQISELNLLQSMYPKPGEVTILNENNLADIQKFVNRETEYLPYHLEFILNLTINNIKLEVCINLPTNYPDGEPDIYIRCNHLNRHQETNLNAKLSEYITDIQNKEVCLYSAVSWIQENIETFSGTPSNEPCRKKDPAQCLSNEKFTRYWVYSHHIYNKKKRDDILKKAKEQNLTGFCLPGKPGIICIEGDESGCKEWWQDIKSLNWKKIALRKVESFDFNEKTIRRKFNNFEELNFQAGVNNKHSNMSEFSKFMSKCDLNEVFSELFGFDE